MNAHILGSPRKILFQHIPKTAGTSLIEQTYAIFPSKVCAARYDAELTDALMEDESYVFFHGHYSHGTVRRFRARYPDAFIFTLMRHPFGRVLSQYHNWKDRSRVLHELNQIRLVQGDTPHLVKLKRRFETAIFRMSLDDFLRSNDRDVAHVVANLQAQYMTDYGPPAHLRYQRAVPNALMYYDFVGLQEFYGPCLQIIEAKCGLPAGSFSGTHRSNTSDVGKADGSYRLRESQVTMIERRNSYDLALFYTVLAGLYRTYGSLLPPLDAEIEGLTGVTVI